MLTYKYLCLPSSSPALFFVLACPLAFLSGCLPVRCPACPVACMSAALHVPLTACPLDCLSAGLHISLTAFLFACLSVFRPDCPLHGLSTSLPVRCLPVRWPSCPPACLSGCLPIRLPAYSSSGILGSSFRPPPPPVTHSIIPLGMGIQVEIDLVYLVFLLPNTYGSLMKASAIIQDPSKVFEQKYFHPDTN